MLCGMGMDLMELISLVAECVAKRLIRNHNARQWNGAQWCLVLSLA